MERTHGPPPAPPRHTRPLRLVQLTDPHLITGSAAPSRLGDTRASFARCLAHARRHHFPADALLLTGDLVHDDDAAYALLAAALEGVRVPVHALAGNHDTAATLPAPLRSRPFTLAPVVRYGAWVLVCLDTIVPGAPHGELGSEALALLRDSLQRNADAHVLIAMHHHPVPMGSRWLDRLGVTNAASLFAVIAGFDNVRGILWGHVHQAFDAMRDGVMLMGTPSTCVQFAPGSDEFAIDDRPPAYRWLQLHPDGRIETRIIWVGDEA